MDCRRNEKTEKDPADDAALDPAGDHIVNSQQGPVLGRTGYLTDDVDSAQLTHEVEDRNRPRSAAHRPGTSSGFAAAMATVNNEEKRGWEGDNALAQTVDLPHCGRTLQNRLVKIALAECLARRGGEMDLRAFKKLYDEWATGGWAMVITGNVSIDPRFGALPWDLRLPWNLTVPPASRVATDPRTSSWTMLVNSFRDLSKASSGSPGLLFIVQLSHPGRQCPPFARPTFARPVAPSPVRVNAQEGSLASSLAHRVMFRTPKQLEDREVEELCRRFGEAAGFLEGCGVDGVQLHGAHGYLISQFLSPLANQRHPSSPFAFRPSNPAHAHHLLRQLLLHIRSHTKPAFCLGIKLSCGEFVEGGLTGEDAMEQVQAARSMKVPVKRDGKESWEGFDFVEVSGGNYANPVFTSTAGPQEAFKSFTSELMASQPADSTTALVLLSGSLRSQPDMQAALSPSGPNRSADLLGFGRPSVLDPQLPKTRLLAIPPLDVPHHRIPNFAFWSSVLSLGGKIQIVGAGVGTLWYDWQIGRIARRLPVKREMGVWEGLRDDWLPGVDLKIWAWVWWAVVAQLVYFLLKWLAGVIQSS